MTIREEEGVLSLPVGTGLLLGQLFLKFLLTCIAILYFWENMCRSSMSVRVHALLHPSVCPEQLGPQAILLELAGAC